MLPFDNKSEFQVLVDMPEGTPLEVTLETARLMGSYLATRVPEVSGRPDLRRASRRPSTSTASSATTSCAVPRTWPTCR